MELRAAGGCFAESARGAVLGLLPARFPRPFAEPAETPPQMSQDRPQCGDAGHLPPRHTAAAISPADGAGTRPAGPTEP